MRRWITGYFIIFLMVFVLGCAASKETQLQQVAKDWCATISASQIIPVYPPTQDIQVGDVFLVQSPVDDQRNEYFKKGFLPMDNHICRLAPSKFKEFYQDSFAGTAAGGLDLPKQWLNDSWADAPLAYFPTYSFSSNKGGGFNLAIPIEGIPVSLSLMGATAGSGTVTITDARTYGIDIMSLYNDISNWADGKRDFLAMYGRNDKVNYLRVINRVYLAGGLDVYVANSNSFGGSGSAGVAKDVNLPNLSNSTSTVTNTLKNYSTLNNFINTSIQSGSKGLTSSTTGAIAGATGGVGGSLKILLASSRSVTMHEKFAKPIVLGYLAFDMPIERDGSLGFPIPTYSILNNLTMSLPEAEKTFYYARLGFMYDNLKDKVAGGDRGAKDIQEEVDKIAASLPDKYPVTIYANNGGSLTTIKAKDASVAKSNFLDYLHFMNDLDASRKAVESMDSLSKAQREELKEIIDNYEKYFEVLRKNSTPIRNAYYYTAP
jgi:hypothetical protein